MEEKREDIFKNLKKISAISGEIEGLKSKVKAIGAEAVAIGKRIAQKDRELKAAAAAQKEREEAEARAAEEAAGNAAEDVSPETVSSPAEVLPASPVEEYSKAEETVSAPEEKEKKTGSGEKKTAAKDAIRGKKESEPVSAEDTSSVIEEPAAKKEEKVPEAPVRTEPAQQPSEKKKEDKSVSSEKQKEKPADRKKGEKGAEPAKAEVSDAPVEKKPDPVLDEKARREARRKAVEEAQARALAEARAKILEQKRKEAIARGEDPDLVKLPSQQPKSEQTRTRTVYGKDGKPQTRREYVPQDGRRGDRPPRPAGAAGGTFPRGPRPAGGPGGKKPVEVTFIPKDTGKSFGNKKKGSEKSYDDKKSINKKSLIKTQVSVEDFDENKTGYRKLRVKKDKKAEQTQTVRIERAVINKEIIPIKELSEKLGISAIEITKKLFKEGIMKTINDSVDYDTAGVIAADLGIELELKLDKTAEDVLNEAFNEASDAEENLVKRPPVVTVMGHVDHGKTSLLDKIRSANVTATEAGGITQHIGAYTVSINGEKITFLDTPGHAAFTAMRQRGAQITDIAVIVIAADDGIMPQTIEAIHHAQAAGVSIIVAANKIDKPQADIERVKKQLADQSVLVEEWGGDVALVPVSAKTGEGIDSLLETIILTADVKELKANPSRMAKGAIVEAKLDKGKGPVATVLIQNGTLHTGDNLVAGTITGRVRAMIDDKGRTVKEAGPSMAVSILGLDEVPNAGDSIFAVEQDKLSKLVAQERKNKEREEMIKQTQKVSLDDLFSKISDGNLKALNLLIKADVQGSVEAVRQSLSELSNEEVKVNVVHAAVGAINETDVMLADSSNAIIIGFNVRPDSKAKALAERSKVDVRLYRIIYEAIDDVTNAMKGLIAPKTQEIYMGKAEVRQTFKITGVGMVAGCYVTEGKIVRNGKLRIYRDDVMICEGNVNQLKRFKDDVKEVSQGFECGISIENFNDIKIGDFIESYIIEVKPVV
ncbi:MAG: translation initiation factor IF-2 [Candidatus Borkfalkiaceae bacterium]|nr:translation initiation factor IF-2 [Christensenellaceae bacterium]